MRKIGPVITNGTIPGRFALAEAVPIPKQGSLGNYLQSMHDLTQCFPNGKPAATDVVSALFELQHGVNRYAFESRACPANPSELPSTLFDLSLLCPFFPFLRIISATKTEAKGAMAGVWKEYNTPHHELTLFWNLTHESMIIDAKSGEVTGHKTARMHPAVSSHNEAWLGVPLDDHFEGSISNRVFRRLGIQPISRMRDLAGERLHQWVDANRKKFSNTVEEDDLSEKFLGCPVSGVGSDVSQVSVSSDDYCVELMWQYLPGDRGGRITHLVLEAPLPAVAQRNDYKSVCHVISAYENSDHQISPFSNQIEKMRDV